MKILLDECLPRKLKNSLLHHDVQTVRERSWTGKKNGELLRLLSGHFDVFITVDNNLPKQQNLANLKIALVVLKAHNNRLAALEALMPAVIQALDSLKSGDILIIDR